jgi:hypothetical protein
MNQQEYLDELKQLYQLAKNKGDIPYSTILLERIHQQEDAGKTVQTQTENEDPCGVEAFKEQADREQQAKKVEFLGTYSKRPKCICQSPSVGIYFALDEDAKRYRVESGAALWRCYGCGEIIGIKQ